MDSSKFFFDSKLINSIFFIFFYLSSYIVHAETVFNLDFADASGDVIEWFNKKKWESRKDISEMNLRFENGRLVIEPTSDKLGVLMREFDEKEYLYGATKIRIEWGVDQYPLGANWNGPKNETRNTREAISFMVFFGNQKLDSGFFLAPDLPHFISFFLGENEKPDKVYFGNYWQKGGRYLCIPCDGSVGKTFITEVDLAKKFFDLFGKKKLPITALGIEIDVQKTKKMNGRHSKAFFKRIEFFY